MTESSLVKTPIKVDRLATLDEVRAAVLRCSDPIMGCREEIPCEIAADVGGYVRVASARLETSLLVEELIRGPDAQGN